MASPKGISGKNSSQAFRFRNFSKKIRNFSNLKPLKISVKDVVNFNSLIVGGFLSIICWHTSCYRKVQEKEVYNFLRIFCTILDRSFYTERIQT